MATFNVSRRAAQGENPKQLRKKGFVPIAIVDRSHKTQMVKAPSDAIGVAVAGADAHGLIDVQIEGESGILRTIVKAMDRDVISRQILSFTLQEVAGSDTVKTEVHVTPTGHNDDADAEDVVLTAVATELKVRSKVDDLPESIEVDVSNLHTGDHLRAGDVHLPEGVELLTPADAVLFNVERIPEPDLPVIEAPEPEPVVEGADVELESPEETGQNTEG